MHPDVPFFIILLILIKGRVLHDYMLALNGLIGYKAHL
jgi:hypothetical protein